MKTERTWVLIADAARATVYETRGVGNGLQAVEGMSFHNDTPPSRDLGRDRPARTHDREGPGRHAIEPKTDPHREDKHDFARFLAGTLGDALARKAFDHIVLVAPPAFLGFLREELPKPVAAVVKAELAKDLTKMPTVELPGHLADAVRV